MKLICEYTEDINVIQEAKEGSDDKNMYIEGIFLQANIKNRNGRRYPKDVLKEEVDRYRKSYIAENRAYGELGHPKGPTINPDRISHRIVSLKEDGDNYIGKAIIHSTAFGNIAKSIIKEGGKLGVSSRGMGSIVERNGCSEVENFHLATAADIVVDPSAPDAFVNGIMEGVEWVWDAKGTLVATEAAAAITREKVESAVRSRTLNEQKMLSLLESYLDMISKNTN